MMNDISDDPLPETALSRDHHNLNEINIEM